MKKKSIIIVIIILLLCGIGGTIWFINSNKETEDVANTDVVPTAVPTEVPTPEPTEVPTPEPTEVPTPEPTEAPIEEEVETPDFEDLGDEDKANVNRNDSDSVDGLPEVKDPEDEPDAPVEDEEPVTPGVCRNTIPENEVQWYLDNLNLTREQFNKLTDKQLADMVWQWSGGIGGGNSGGGDISGSGNTGGGTSGGNSGDDGDMYDNTGMEIEELDPNGVPAGSM